MKEDITRIVGEYIKDNPEEFESFKTMQRIKYEQLENPEFAKVKDSYGMQRHLHEVPETLYNALSLQLEDEAWDYFISKQGAIWFANKFPVFRVGEKAWRLQFTLLRDVHNVSYLRNGWTRVVSGTKLSI